MHWSSECRIDVSTCVPRWISDIEAYTPNSKVDYPIISDPTKDIATLCASCCLLRQRIVLDTMATHVLPRPGGICT